NIVFKNNNKEYARRKTSHYLNKNRGLHEFSFGVSFIFIFISALLLTIFVEIFHGDFFAFLVFVSLLLILRDFLILISSYLFQSFFSFLIDIFESLLELIYYGANVFIFIVSYLAGKIRKSRSFGFFKDEIEEIFTFPEDYFATLTEIKNNLEEKKLSKVYIWLHLFLIRMDLHIALIKIWIYNKLPFDL
ncbi:MAG: hypothetical protein AAGA60_04375, partial [Cyanobacteria bacterium P01_E01_bin.42]